eukprot:364080-Chlamydomonas_euryale.AAC.1
MEIREERCGKATRGTLLHAGPPVSARPMETKLVRCDERSYREPGKPTRKEMLFGRLATDKSPSGRNGNNDTLQRR